MTGDTPNTDRCRFTTEASSSHHNRRIVYLTVDGEQFAIPAFEAREFFRHLSTTLGCLEGFNADIYTEINEMVRDDRDKGVGGDR
ncbi:hypothetical protein [Haloarcula salina]|uniref:Uncharacterized protein n=1 Tax=Haloarcula salina TaxID=1429914 RepID=A0AA41G5K6_9EURY|nr:hypothetical protein [Haloarcula salina]MBV0903929.1 hypothetical protein [Haloarcula salina]